MNPPTIVIEADLQSDGQTLRLEKKLTLPAGKVRVVVQPLSENSANDPNPIG